jgi:predicted XRE-type DNA-binding protein
MSFITTWLRKNNLTRQQLADELDMCKDSIDKMITGRMRVRKVVKLAMLWIQSQKELTK